MAVLKANKEPWNHDANCMLHAGRHVTCKCTGIKSGGTESVRTSLGSCPSSHVPQMRIYPRFKRRDSSTLACLSAPHTPFFQKLSASYIIQISLSKQFETVTLMTPIPTTSENFWNHILNILNTPIESCHRNSLI